MGLSSMVANSRDCTVNKQLSSGAVKKPHILQVNQTYLIRKIICLRLEFISPFLIRQLLEQLIGYENDFFQNLYCRLRLSIPFDENLYF